MSCREVSTKAPNRFSKGVTSAAKAERNQHSLRHAEGSPLQSSAAELVFRDDSGGLRNKRVDGQPPSCFLVPMRFPTESLEVVQATPCLLYTSPSPRDRTRSRMPS